MEHIVKIKHIEDVTHDVKHFVCEKPADYTFTPGQATEVSINAGAWKEEKRPFTFTSLNENEDLEFTIKIYSDHAGVTHQLGELNVGDELILRDIWGAIEYQGPGYFIAGGAGITPFIAILRQLEKEGKLKDNKLLFFNKTDRDIILKTELDKMLGNDAIYVTTDQEKTEHVQGYPDQEFLKETIDDFRKKFYVCGPEKMIEAVVGHLKDLGVKPENIVQEE